MSGVLIFFLSTIASAMIVCALMRAGKSLPLMDRPNERSSHSKPTMRGGGVAIVSVVTVATILEWHFSSFAAPAVVIVITGALLVGGIGLADDLLNLSAAVRLVFQFIASCVVIALVYQALLPAGTFAKSHLLTSLLMIATLFGMLWLINLYNFMDGIDGIAGVEGLSVALSVVLVILLQGVDSQFTGVLIASAGACLGFLVFNWPPAKIFMGDVGSGFLGFLFASMALVTHLETSVTVWTWAIVLAVFLVDASLTLSVRLLRGERIHEPHRSHAYQNAARRFGSHRFVTAIVALINGFWLFPLAWLSAVHPDWGPAMMLLSWAPLLALGVLLSAGCPDSPIDR